MKHIIGDAIGVLCLFGIFYGGLWVAAILEEIWR